MIVLLRFSRHLSLAIALVTLWTRLPTITCQFPYNCISAADSTSFWSRTDYGYPAQFSSSVRPFCSPFNRDELHPSWLHCSSGMHYCEGRNLKLDFSELNLKEGRQYMDNVLPKGAILGRCTIDKGLLEEGREQASFLQSWYHELSRLSSTRSDLSCDIHFRHPVILMKLDAVVNMFHHFCDFFNLFATMQINNVLHRDPYIFLWETSGNDYYDWFSETYGAFSNHSVLLLKDFQAKSVCFDELVFSLLPRMVNGLYYNSYIEPNCRGSALFRHFSRFVLDRLNIVQMGPVQDKVRITVLDRKSQWRNILNQAELVAAMANRSDWQVEVVAYDMWLLPFVDQLRSTFNSDVFIGMHGAGLTHALFLPDWAVVFELYNCDDPHCYYDLARLRGVKYITWDRDDLLFPQDQGHHPTLGAHKKFTNYRFDVDEFISKVETAVDYVRRHRLFIEARDAVLRRDDLRRDDLQRDEL